MTAPNKRLAVIVCIAAALLAVPLLAMQFTREVAWTASDFLVAGGLLLGTGLACELVLRTVKTRRLRIVACVSVFLACVLIWLELAVGVFGTPIAGS